MRCRGATLGLAVLLANVGEPVSASSTTLKANPIRRVIVMLQMMGKKIESEGKKEENLFDKFMCYCENGGGELKASIKAAETKVPQLESGIQEVTAEKAKLAGDLTKARQDVTDAKSTLAEATAIREKESVEFAQSKTDYEVNIAAMGKAITALGKGMTGFLQTKAASVIRALTVSMDMTSSDRDMLSSFLSGGQGEGEKEGYTPQSGEIVGLLEQMKENMEGELADSIKGEAKAKAEFEEMSKAKEEQVAALARMIEDKTARDGEAAVELVTMQTDLEDTSTALAEDSKFLRDLDKNCKSKKAEWEIRQKMRTAEQLAIAETIKILNDDNALDLFKKTLPGATSFLQVQASSKELKQQALSLVQAARHKHPSMRLDLVSIALRAKKTSFTKIIKMIDEMVTLLGKEQADDDQKKAYCRTELDESEDKLKGLNVDISDATKEIEEAKERMATLASDIAALGQGIQDLDKQVAESTETRKEENDNYSVTLAANNAAVELLGIAKNRLNKFYDPKLYKANVQPELSAEDQVYVNMGGEISTPAPSGIAGTGVTALIDTSDNSDDSSDDSDDSFLQLASKSKARSGDSVAPPPPPEAFGSYKKQDEGNGGVMALIDMLVADVEKDITEMKTEEEQAQTEYEQMVKDAAEKRALDSSSITEKEGAKADLEERLHKMTTDKAGLEKEEMDTSAYHKDMHGECDWLLANHEVRKEARADEVEALKKATSVLSGADYSFMQTSMRTIHRLA